MSKKKEILTGVGVVSVVLIGYVLGFKYQLIHQLLSSILVVLTCSIVLCAVTDDHMEEPIEEDGNY